MSPEKNIFKKMRHSYLTLCLLLGFVVLCTASIVFAQVIDQSMLDFINSNPKHGWKAVETVAQSPFARWSAQQARDRLFMHKTDMPVALWESLQKQRREQQLQRESGVIPSVPVIGNSNGLPSEFDSRVQWPQCIHPIRDQGNCGSCYSFASSGILSDRFCIHSNGTINVLLSAQDLVSCSSLTFHCSGGPSQLVYLELEKYGIVPDECLPYTSGQTGTGGTCPKNVTCYGKEWKMDQLRFKVSKYSHIGNYLDKAAHRAEVIQKELVTNGPVDALFNVFGDFMSYSSGVYRHVSGGYMGVHAVRVIGYGVDSESGLPYWLVANSWGTRWGMQGFFKFLRGTDMCGFELMVYAGLPDIAHAPRIH